MKNTFILFTLALIGFNSCNLIDPTVKFNIEFDSEATVPATTGVNIPIDVMTPDVETNSTATFESNNTNKDLLREVILTDLTLTLTSPANADFSFLNEISIFIAADGLNEAEIASKTNISATPGAVLKLDLTGVDVQEYIKKDEFSLRVNAVTDEAISQDHDLNIFTKFQIKAGTTKK